MNVQNLADTLNTLAAARSYSVRARADYGPEGTNEAIEFVDMNGNSIMTLTRTGSDSTAFAAAAERSLNGLGDNPPTMEMECHFCDNLADGSKRSFGFIHCGCQTVECDHTDDRVCDALGHANHN